MLTKEKSKRKFKKENSYPYITSDSKILKGIPIIEGTRIAVRTIAGYYQIGMNVDEILSSLGHLSQSQVHSALAYYFDNKKEIDKQISENSDMEFWKKKVLEIKK